MKNYSINWAEEGKENSYNTPKGCTGGKALLTTRRVMISHSKNL